MNSGFASLSLKAKLLVWAGGSLGLMAIVALMAFGLMLRQESSFLAVIDEAAHTDELLRQCESYLAGVHLGAHATVGAATLGATGGRVDELKKQDLQLLESLSGAAEKLAAGLGDAHKKERQGLQEKLDKYRSSLEAVLQMVSIDAATASIMMSTVENDFVLISQELRGTFQILRAEQDMRKQEVQNRVRSFMLQFVVVFFIVSVVAVFIAFRLSKSISRPIIEAVHGLKAITRELLNSASGMATLSQNVAASSQEQGAAIHQSVAAVAEMNSMIERAMENTQATRVAAQETLVTADKTRGKVASASSVAQELEQSSERLEEISQVVDQIRVETRVIHDIVFKTQLLSFNASIEAARAGVHGRGFAVVAEEVGTLARTSGEAAQRIAALLERSRGAVTSVVGDLRGRAEHLTGETNEMVVLMEQLHENNRTLSTLVDAIAETHVQNRQGLGQTSSALDQMAATARSYETAIQSMETNSERLLTIGRSLETVSQGFLMLAHGNREKAYG